MPEINEPVRKTAINYVRNIGRDLVCSGQEKTGHPLVLVETNGTWMCPPHDMSGVVYDESGGDNTVYYFPYKKLLFNFEVTGNYSSYFRAVYFGNGAFTGTSQDRYLDVYQNSGYEIREFIPVDDNTKFFLMTGIGNHFALFIYLDGELIDQTVQYNSSGIYDNDNSNVIGLSLDLESMGLDSTMLDGTHTIRFEITNIPK